MKETNKIAANPGNAHVGTAALGCPVERSSTPALTSSHKLRYYGALCLLLAVLPAIAQDIKIPPAVEKLSAKSKETVEVTMDGPMLRWASKFLSADDPDEAKAAKLVANLKGIYVRSYEFDKDGEYSSADVDALRAQIHTPPWSRIVGVRSAKDGENVDVFFKLEDDRISGIVVIDAEPRELTFVNIQGQIEVDQLADLGGEFGIPRLDRKSLSKAHRGESK
jgi:hypothetical protein